jgi:hypothetical protein
LIEKEEKKLLKEVIEEIKKGDDIQEFELTKNISESSE